MWATLIRPKAPPLTKKGEWLESALKQDPLLKALPNWARDKAIDGAAADRQGQEVRDAGGAPQPPAT